MSQKSDFQNVGGATVQQLNHQSPAPLSTRLGRACVWKLFFLSFLTKTKQGQALPSHIRGKIWPRSTKFWIGFLGLRSTFLGHPVQYAYRCIHPCISLSIRVSFIKKDELTNKISENQWFWVWVQVHLAANDRPSIRGNNFGRSLFQQKQLTLMSENLVSIGVSLMSKKHFYLVYVFKYISFVIHKWRFYC